MARYDRNSLFSIYRGYDKRRIFSQCLSGIRCLSVWTTLFLLAVAVLIFLSVMTSFSESPRDRVIHTFRPHQRPLPEAEAHHNSPKPVQGSSEKSNADWSFRYPRDARNYALTEKQCQSAFPLLYKEVDRAVEHRREKKIQLEELDTGWRGDGISRMMIYDNQLYIIETRNVDDPNHRPRQLASMNAIYRAVVASQEPIPNIEFTLTDHDWADAPHGNHTTWTYTRQAMQEYLWLIPDFGLWGWPDVGLRSMSEVQALILDNEVEFWDKIPKLIWRGSLAVGSHDVRSGLVRNAQDQPWSDVRVLDWSNRTNIQQNLIGMEDHCAYQYVAQTEGNSYSGRLKYLMNCQSILLCHDLNFIEHYHSAMRSSGPDQNYVKVRRDYSDLKDTMEEYLRPENYEIVERVAYNARTTFRERYLTPAAEACYWRHLFRGWSQVQGFTPQFWKENHMETDGANFTSRKPRGTPFESYTIMGAVEWDIPAKPRKIVEFDKDG